MEIIGWIRDYSDLLVALLFLAVAVYIIPGRAKWYVLTGGLAFIGYEAYVRTANRRNLEEADRKREELRKQAAELAARRDALAGDIAQLNRELAASEERAKALAAERAGLAAQGAAADARLAELNRRHAELARETDERRRVRDQAGSVALEMLEAERALDAARRATGQEGGG